MAEVFQTCDSCGAAVTRQEFEDGGAFFDGENCYCAICVGRIIQKVRSAQRGQRMKTTGVVFEKGLTKLGPRTPAWLIYTLIAEVAAAVILLTFMLFPAEAKLPGKDPGIQEEIKIKSMLAEAETELSSPQQARKALFILQNVDNIAIGTAWSSLVKERLREARKLLESQAKGAFDNAVELYDKHVSSSDFDLAIAALDQFPQQFRNTRYWKEEIPSLRKKALFYKEARTHYHRLLSEAVSQTRAQDYDKALELLRSFPAKYSDTPAYVQVQQKIKETVTAREKLAGAEGREEEDHNRREQEKQRRLASQKEAQRRAQEQARREAERIRRAEEEERLKKEAQRTAADRQKPPPQDQPKPKDQDEHAWEEVKLEPGTAKSFLFATPSPSFQKMETTARKQVYEIPYPHVGRSGTYSVVDTGKSIAVDTNADGKTDRTLRADGGVVVLSLYYAEGKKRSCAIEIGRRKDKLQYRRYGWLSGRYQGTRITIIDENSSGYYNEVGKEAIIVGNSKKAVVLGNIVAIKDKFYEIVVEGDGSMLRLRPYRVDTGKLSMTKGFSARGKLTYVVVSGKLPDTKYVFSIELSSQRRAVPVPAGEYCVSAGSITSSSGSKIAIRGGKKAKKFAVEAGKTVAPRWGAPGVIEFSYTVGQDRMLKISAYAIKIYGRLGERYTGWGPRDFVPRVQVRNEKGKLLGEKSFTYKDDFSQFYLFEMPVPPKVKVRIVGEPLFLGKCASEWK